MGESGTEEHYGDATTEFASAVDEERTELRRDSETAERESVVASVD